MTSAVVLFTRDLRVRDNPALHAAGRVADHVVPLFVLDPRAPTSPNRRRFLAESLADLRDSLRHLGADLVIREGDPVRETMRVAGEVGAHRIHLAADVSGYAATRERRLRDACAAHRLRLDLFDSLTVVAPGALTASGGGPYRVFTPYWRVWQRYPRRRATPTPRRLRLPDGVELGRLPAPVEAGTAPDAARGGESSGLARLAAWRPRAGAYAEYHDDLAADATSRLSPYLHFGCVSALAIATTVTGAEAFVRQLCWRDFYAQVLAGFRTLGRDAFRRHAVEEWSYDDDTLAAWQAGQTGVPIVDAGMRQLTAQGFMPNRARLVTATFLTRVLGLDWRDGLRWYARHLLDADVANNAGNWQWVAGTGTDPRPNRQFNPVRQAERYDPGGDYVRRWVPELAGVPGRAVHQPWRLPGQSRLRYPPPLARSLS
jgi:deoxyribodipyrimidine photo-lyase